LKEKYNIFSKFLIKNSPFLWIKGVHKILPWAIILFISSVFIGAILPIKIYNYSSPLLYSSSIFLGFLSLIIFVFFVIRQLKYSSTIKDISTYFYFIFFVLLLSITPFIPAKIYNVRLIKKINKVVKDNDLGSLYHAIITLNDNLVYFYTNLNTSIFELKETDKRGIEFFDEYIKVYERVGFTSSSRSIDNNTFEKSNKNALNEISDFLDIANKIGVKVSENNPVKIFNQRKLYSSSQKEQIYNLLIIDSVSNPKDIFLIYKKRIEKYNILINHIRRFDELSYKNEILIQKFLLFSIIIALLLWMVVSNSIKDFSSAIFGGAIITTFVYIISLLIYELSNVYYHVAIFTHFSILIVFIFAFGKTKNSLVKRASIIFSQLLIPVLFVLFLYDYIIYIGPSHSNWSQQILVERFIGYIISITIVLTVFFYKNIYRNSRILPR